MARAALTLALGLLAACSYVIPASWRAFRAPAERILPVVSYTLQARRLDIASSDAEKREVITGWTYDEEVTERVRMRFIVRWDHDERDGTEVIYVRHEAQTIDDAAAGSGRFGPVTHDPSAENALLDAITLSLLSKDPLPAIKRERRPPKPLPR